MGIAFTCAIGKATSSLRVVDGQDGGQGASWLRCVSPRTDSPFIRMSEERECEARLGTIINEWVARLSANPSSGIPTLELCAFPPPYHTLWFVSPTPQWQDALDFEHRPRERVPPNLVLAGWHNVEVYAIRPAARARYYVSAMSSEWDGLQTTRMLLVPTPPFISYYSNMVLTGSNRSLAFAIARTEFAVSVVMQFLTAASAGVTHTFSSDDRLAPGQPCLIALQNAVVDLVTDVGFLAITYQSQFDFVLALRAWDTMRNVFWATVSEIPQCRWLPYNFATGKVRLIPRSGRAPVVQDKRSILLPVGPVSNVDQVIVVPSLSAMSRAVANFHYEKHEISKTGRLSKWSAPSLQSITTSFYPRIRSSIDLASTIISLVSGYH